MRHFYLKTFNCTCNTFFNIILRLLQNFNIDMRTSQLWEPKQHPHTHTCSAAHPCNNCYQEVWEETTKVFMSWWPSAGLYGRGNRAWWPRPWMSWWHLERHDDVRMSWWSPNVMMTSECHDDVPTSWWRWERHDDFPMSLWRPNVMMTLGTSCHDDVPTSWWRWERHKDVLFGRNDVYYVKI